MGYATYTVYRNGEELEAGYAVDATCDEPDCFEEIDRGLGYLCGVTPGGDEYGCGGYFCGEHLYFCLDDDGGWVCLRCLEGSEADE